MRARPENRVAGGAPPTARGCSPSPARNCLETRCRPLSYTISASNVRAMRPLPARAMSTRSAALQVSCQASLTTTLCDFVGYTRILARSQVFAVLAEPAANESCRGTEGGGHRILEPERRPRDGRLIPSCSREEFELRSRAGGAYQHTVPRRDVQRKTAYANWPLPRLSVFLMALNLPGCRIACA